MRAPFVPWAFGSLKPEATERRVYLGLTLLAPALVLVVWAVVRRLDGGAPGRSAAAFGGGRPGRLAGGTLAGLACATAAYLTFTLPFVPQVFPLRAGYNVALGAGTLALWFTLTTRRLPRAGTPRRRRGRRAWAGAWRGLGLGVALALTLTSVLALRVFGFRAAVAANPVHLNTVLYSMVQVMGGQHLLVDVIPQYGLYAEFLKPWFALVGLSVPHFVLALSGLQLLAMVALVFTLWRFLRSNALLWLGSATFGWLMMMNWSDVVFDRLDPYFQYFPVRVVFPAVSVALAGAYLRRRTSPWAVAGAVFGGLGVWWNVDSGAVTLVAWFVLLTTRAVSGRRAGRPPGSNAGDRWRWRWPRRAWRWRRSTSCSVWTRVARWTSPGCSGSRGFSTAAAFSWCPCRCGRTLGCWSRGFTCWV